MTVSSPFVDGDHCTVEFGILAKVPKQPNNTGGREEFSYNFGKARKETYDDLNRFFAAVDWRARMRICYTVQEKFQCFMDIVHKALSDIVGPKISKGPKKLYPINIRKKQRKKAKLWKRRNTEEGRRRYLDLTNEVRNEIRALDEQNETRVLEGGSDGLFFNHVGRVLKFRKQIAPLLNESGELEISDQGKAEILNRFYGSVFTLDNGELPPFERRVPPQTFVDSVDLSSLEVLKFAKKLKPKLSKSPDGIPAVVLKRCSLTLAAPLSIIFEKSLETGTLPDAWKKANICPIFKKGKRASPSNYRPVSLTSPTCKLMERIIRDRITRYLDQNGLISGDQHGFRKGRSTCTQLLECTKDWTLANRDKLVTDVIYLDFAKCFDSVSHPKLLYKLSKFGIQGNLLNWIKGFLVGRTQVVVIEGKKSGEIQVLSGCPQGSVLGPLLFLIFADEIFEQVQKVKIKLYADDSKLYHCFKKDSEEAISLQEDLTRVFEWAEKWQLKLSLPKCEVLHLGHGNQRYVYRLGNADLRATESIRDLGVQVSTDLKYHRHIDNICAKARSRIYLLFRVFKTKCEKALIKGYCTYVRPILEYCSPVWNPSYLGDLDKLEKIQKLFTRRLYYRINPRYERPVYSVRLNRYGLETLEERRLRADLKFYYSIYRNQSVLNFGDFFERSTRVNARLGNDCALCRPRFRTLVRKHHFCVRAIDTWNALPNYVVNSQSQKSFTKNLKTVDLAAHLHTARWD